ncbi:uncharacterized protein LOC122501121 [Leptopilina heterotoma]|uniref:uncharacterized protein LOC122501121 n=1 Tax=Leptopilina heterotoma TaxID=63436 RepID=UPI001CA7BDCA|nr:uncharacterized protein LOC122501121 [Leptopilina heterotoma]
MSLNFGFNRLIVWNFRIASVPYPILGADLLSSYGLNVDLRGRKLIDSHSRINTVCEIGLASCIGVSVVDKSNTYMKILAKFPSLTGLPQSENILSQGIMHHIITNGPPVAERTRRLSPAKLIVAKNHFREKLESAEYRQSTASWASPLHMAPKKWGGWSVWRLPSCE